MACYAMHQPNHLIEFEKDRCYVATIFFCIDSPKRYTFLDAEKPKDKTSI